MGGNEKQTSYWKKNLQYLSGLLTIRFIVSYGCGIPFVDQLDKIRIGGGPLHRRLPKFKRSSNGFVSPEKCNGPVSATR